MNCDEIQVKEDGSSLFSLDQHMNISPYSIQEVEHTVLISSRSR